MISTAPSNDVATAARMLRDRGFALCKPDAGTKKPSYREWGTRSLEPDAFGPRDLIGIIGGPLSDGGRDGHANVPIDLDALEAIERADEFLPDTGMIEGRPGKPRSHRYYLVPRDSIPAWAESYAEQSAEAAYEEMGFRGPFSKSFRHADTNAEVMKFIGTGAMTVAPPSRHPSGEVREWDGGEPGEPVVVPFPVLWDAVCRLAHACGCKMPSGLSWPWEATPKQEQWTKTTFTYRDTSDPTKRAIAYLAKLPPAISGQGGRDATLWAARVVVWGFDLGPQVGFDILDREYNPRCQPKWSEKELRAKCREADVVPFDKPRGWLRDTPAPERNGYHAAPSRNGSPPAAGNESPTPPESERASIVLTAELDSMAEQVLGALAARDDGIFQRCGRLVHIRRGVEPPAFLIRTDETAAVELVSDDHLGVRVSRVCRFLQQTEDKKGDKVFVHKQPPERLIRAVRSIPTDRIRPLTALVTAPTLRPDGTLVVEPGYDERTGLYFEAAGCPAVEVPERPSREEVARALEILLYPFADFPFAEPCHRAAAVAAVLTIAGRFAFTGCVPLFLIDANRAGTGKGLLADAAILIPTGTPPASMANTVDDAEMRKRLLSLALSADQVVKLDNIAEHEFLGTSSLDSAITAGVIGDRILGRSENVKLPLRAVFFGTGNNVRLAGDMPRRVCHIRLETPLENPEERPDVRERRLLDHVREHRGRYLSAALTILRGWFAAGKPTRPLPTWGSFEGWSDVIRQCVVWAGLADPYETRRQLLAQADPVAGPFRVLVRGWSYLDPASRGIPAARIIESVRQSECEPERIELRESLKAAILELCPGKGEDLPSPKTLGRRLSSLRGRVVEGMRLVGTEDRKGVVVWFVRPVT